MSQRSFTLLEILLYSCLFLLSSFFYYNIENWVIETIPTTLHPAYFPSLIAALITVFFALLVLFASRALMQYSKVPLVEDLVEQGTDSAGTTDADTSSEGRPSYSLLIAYIITLLLYLLALPYFGFLITTPIVMFCVAYLLGLKRYFIAFLFYCFFAWLINASSFHILQIILPQGTLFY